MPPVDVKQAASIAVNYVKSLLQNPIQDVELEEVELSDDERFWLITIGFVRTPSTAAQNFRSLVGDAIRSYQLVKIEVATGIPLSMKMRTL
jgi:hypothetical protein